MKCAYIHKDDWIENASERKQVATARSGLPQLTPMRWKHDTLTDSSFTQRADT